MSKKPVHEIRFGRVKASIWSNKTQNGSTRYRISIVTLYKDEADKWQQSKSYPSEDLLLVSKVAYEADTWIHEQLAAERKTNAAA